MDSAEQLQLSPAYIYAQVIGSNEARKPGAGSAIFMHVDQGRGTAGYVPHVGVAGGHALGTFGRGHGHHP